MSKPPAIPLARLFAMGMGSLVDRLHERLDEGEFAGIRSDFAFVLLAARDSTPTGNEVAQLMGTTKQGASKLVDAMEAEGLVVRRPHPEDARAKAIHLAPRGRRMLAAAEAIYAELETEWARVLGRGRLEELRRDLERALRATHDGGLPPIRPSR